MAEEKMAWARQPDDRQWNGPEGDDPRTLYQMLMTSVERFGNEPCFGYIPEPGMARVHLDYNEFGELATSVAKRLNDCLLYTSPSPRDMRRSRMPSSA